jgi:hypothetical protein
MKIFIKLLPLVKKILLSLFCILLFLTLFFKSNAFSHTWLIPTHTSIYNIEVNSEQYDSELGFLDSMPKLEKYFLSEIQKKELTKLEAIYFADQLLRDRFLHRDNIIALSDNWALYLIRYFSKNRTSSLYISSLDLSYILKSEYAICNQQALIFQELMRAINVDYQSVLFNIPSSPVSFGHFASAAGIDGDWFFIDSNLEPSYKEPHSFILPRLLSSDTKLFNEIYPAYEVSTIPAGAISIASLNKNPAYWGHLLQKITGIFSNYAWLLALIAYFGCELLSMQVNKKNLLSARKMQD